MSKILLKTFDIREGEGLRASLMFAYIFFIVAALMIIKPVRNSLFLSELGITQLPYVYVLVALFAALVASVYSKFAKKARLNRLVLNTLLIVIANLFIFWIFFHIGYRMGWFLYLFYIWVTVFGVISTSQFWLLAGYIFNTREARRLFGFVGTGAISGGIFGGYLTSYLANVFGSENLILFCIGFLLICVLILVKVWGSTARQNYLERLRQYRRLRQVDITDNPVKIILNSRHLLYLSGIIGVGVIVATMVDYQFSAVASSTIADEDRLTAFFGFWLSTLSVASLIFQLFLTSRILKYFGVGVSLFFLPIGILIGAAAVLFSPALWSAIMVKVSDGSFKHSINKAGTELLSLPIPAGIKNKVKTFIDVFVDNLAKGLGGVLLLVLTILLNFPVQLISLVIIALIAIWIYLTVRVKNEYVNSFRLAIEKRTIDIEEQPINLHDASILDSIVKVLSEDNERQILYVLDFIENVDDEQVTQNFRRLVHHPSKEIRSKVLRMVRGHAEVDFSSEAQSLVEDESQEVRTEAIGYLCKHSEDPIKALKSFLSHRDYRIQGAALMCAAKESMENKEFGSTLGLKGYLDEMLRSTEMGEGNGSREIFVKLNAAKIIGTLKDPDLYPILHKLLESETVEVVQAAVTSAGQTRETEFIPILVSYLNNKTVRKFASSALAEFGEEIIDDLIEHLTDPGENRNIRTSIPKVLALVDSQKSVNILVSNLDQSDLRIRYEIIKALNRLKTHYPILKFDEKQVEEGILIETKDYLKMITILYTTGKYDTIKSGDSLKKGENNIEAARQLLINALEEKLDNNLERIFRLLGLKFQPEDMFNAYMGITSSRSHLRANAVEFLDNVLNSHLKKFIIPIVETSSVNLLIDQSQELFGFDVPSEPECFTQLLEGNDNWLKVCSMYLMSELHETQCISGIENLLNDSDPIVMETAEFALTKLGRLN
jgi:AAA family ATP:ADP antiporter